MMTGPRTREILEQWRALAASARMPAEAPRPSRTTYPLGIGAIALALVIAVAAIAGRGLNPSGSTAENPGSTPATSAFESIPAIMAGPTGLALGSPGSTVFDACSAAQFSMGEVTSAPGFGALGTQSVFVTQRLRNVGERCVLELPNMIEVAPASGGFETVSVVNGGSTSSFAIEPGRAFAIVIGAWWYVPALLSGTGVTPPPCSGAISRVTRVEIPLASDSVPINLGTVWAEACASPATVSITVED